MTNKLEVPFTKKLLLELFAHYRNVQAKIHDLTYLFWECTLRCNLDCKHCGSDCLTKSDCPDMPLEDFLKVLDEISTQYDPRKIMLALTGGEPLLRKDLEEAGREFKKRGFRWGTVTNGYWLDEDRLNSLLEAGLGSITISIDGLEENHNWLRGHNDSFARALNAAKLCAQVDDLTFDVVTCVNQKNFNELDQIKEMLIDAGIKHWRIFTIFPKGRATEHEEMILEPEQLHEMLEFIQECRQEGRIIASTGCDGFYGKYEGQVRDGYFFCRAGVNVGSVLVDGSISACPSLRDDYIQGNIYQNNFLDIWNEKFDVMRNRKWMRESKKCKDCEVKKWCGGEGMHLRHEKTGDLLYCHYDELKKSSAFNSL